MSLNQVVRDVFKLEINPRILLLFVCCCLYQTSCASNRSYQGLTPAAQVEQERRLTPTELIITTESGTDLIAAQLFEQMDFRDVSAAGSGLLAWSGQTLAEVKAAGEFSKYVEQLKFDANVDRLVVSPSGKFVALSSFSLVRVFSLADGSEQARIMRVKGSFTALAFSKDETQLAFGRSDGVAYVWKFLEQDSARRRNVEEYRGARSPIVSLHFHPAGRTLLVVERSGVVRVWRLLTAEERLGVKDFGAIREREARGLETKNVSVGIPKVLTSVFDEQREQLIVLGAKGELASVKIRGFRVILTGALTLNGASALAVSDIGGAQLVLVGDRSGLLHIQCPVDGNFVSLGQLGRVGARAIGAIVNEAGRLWLLEKSGKLLTFKQNSLQQALQASAMFGQCD